MKNESVEDIEEYESDFEQFRFNMSSPDLSIYSGVLETTIPKLFSGESLENIHEKSSIPTPESTSGESSGKRSPQVVLPNLTQPSSSSPLKIAKQPSPLINVQVPPPTLVTAPHNDEPISDIITGPDEQVFNELQTTPTPTLKRQVANVNWNEILLKKQRLEDALNHITARQVQVKANLHRLSVQNTSYLSHPTPPNNLLTQQVQTSGIVGIQQDHTPYVTPHDTPYGTPVPSPLPPSPHLVYPTLHYTSQPPTPHPSTATPQNLSQPSTPINSSLPTSPTGYKTTPTNSHNYFFHNQPLVYHGPNSFPSLPSTVSTMNNLSSGFPSTPLQHSNGTCTTSLYLPYNGGGALSSVPGSAVTSPIAVSTYYSDLG